MSGRDGEPPLAQRQQGGSTLTPGAGFLEVARSVPNAMLLLDGDGVVVALNVPAQEVFGPVGLVGSPLADRVAEPAQLAEYLRLCARSAEAVPGALSLLRQQAVPSEGTPEPPGSPLRLRAWGARGRDDGDALRIVLHLQAEGHAGIASALLDRKLAELDHIERSLRAEQLARLRAELLAARLGQLQTLTEALSRVTSAEDLVQATLTHRPPLLDAVSTSIFLHGADRKTLELAGAHGVPSILRESFASVPADDDSLLPGRAASTGMPVWIEGPEELVEQAPVIGPHAIAIGIDSLAVLPLQSGGGVLGVMTLGFRGTRRLSAEEQSFAITATNQCAQALDRVLAHARAERAAARAARLQDLAAALADARTRADVATAVVNQGCAAIGAPRGLITELDEEGAALRVLRTFGYPEAGQGPRLLVLMSEPHPSTDAVRWRRPVFLQTRAAVVGRYPLLAAHLAGGGERAMVALPLVARDRVLGALALVFDEVRRFDEEDRAYLLGLAQQCAQALDRAGAHEAEARARAAADAANVTKDEFLSTLSHELRTPLTSILGWANILRTRALEPAATARALGIIERNARAQVQLIEDILDVSRIVAGKLRLSVRPVEPAAIVRAALEVVRPVAEARHLRIEAVLDGAPGTLPADPDRLQQIALNLLTNAVKFSPEGGVIEVRLDRHGGGVRLQIRDHGEGIDARFLPHVFERFRQADSSDTRAHGGLGLGLAIVKHLVELHHGTIVASSAGAGQGALFTVTLPAHAAVARVAVDPALALRHEPTPPTGSGSHRLAGVRVVVVDDELDARELIASILQEQGAAVTTASSALEALRAVELAPPDVLVSDIGMARQDGYALLHQVRALAGHRARTVPALALTAYAGREAVRRAEVAGFQRHMAKPVLPARLIDEVAWLAGRGTPG